MRRLTLTLAAAALLAGLPAPAHAASLSLRPAIAQPGATVAAEGTGWRPGTRVVVRRRGGALLGVGTVGPDRRFTAPLRIPQNLRLGRQPVVARGGRDRLEAPLRLVAAPRDWAPKEMAFSYSPVRVSISRTVAFPTAPVRVDFRGLEPGDLAAARLRGEGTVRTRADRRGRARLLLSIAGARLDSSTLTLRGGRLRRVEPFYVLPPQTIVPALPAPSRPNPLLVAVGDIACYPGEPKTPSRCHHEETSDLALSTSPEVVTPLGDLQYDSATAEEFAEYDRTWGRLRDRTRPAVGNHEYGSPFGGPYFSYFGSAAGTPDRGYYSYDVGAWHVVALNSNCGVVGCSRQSRQVRWLRADLAAHPDRCTLAYWHHPRHSSAQQTRENTSMQPMWEALHQGGADLVLTGHVHNYERIAPLDAEGRVDPVNGIRSFVVGTGGRNYQAMPRLKPYSESANTDTFGVLLVSLRPDGYGWLFAPEPGDDFTDTGSAACR